MKRILISSFALAFAALVGSGCTYNHYSGHDSHHGGYWHHDYWHH